MTNEKTYISIIEYFESLHIILIHVGSQKNRHANIKNGMKN